jgi:hypothetical protein
MPKFNPFRPNSIVTSGMFCGRWDEMRSIAQSLFQTKHGNPKHFLVQGRVAPGPAWRISKALAQTVTALVACLPDGRGVPFVGEKY